MRNCDIGKMRHRIEIQSQADTRDDHGGLIGAWTTDTTVWASIQTLTGRKLEIARQIDAEANVEIHTRYCGDGGSANITVDNRILFGERILEPVYVVNDYEMDRCLTIMCKEKRGELDA